VLPQCKGHARHSTPVLESAIKILFLLCHLRYNQALQHWSCQRSRSRQQGSLPRISDCMRRLPPRERKRCRRLASSKRHIHNPPPQLFLKVRRKPTPTALLLFPNNPNLRIQSGSARHRSRRYSTNNRLQQRSRARVFRIAPHLQIAKRNMRPRREQHRDRSSLAHLPHLTHSSRHLCHDVAVVLGVHRVAGHVDGAADVESSVDELALLGCRSL
jgi:hypothetical protein